MFDLLGSLELQEKCLKNKEMSKNKKGPFELEHI